MERCLTLKRCWTWWKVTLTLTGKGVLGLMSIIHIFITNSNGVYCVFRCFSFGLVKVRVPPSSQEWPGRDLVTLSSSQTDRMQPKVKLFTGFHRHKCFLVKYLNGFSFSSNYIRWCSRSGLRCSPLWLISLWIGPFQTVLLLTHCLHPSVCSSRVKGHSFMPNLKERWDDLASDYFMRIKTSFFDLIIQICLFSLS